MQICDLGEQGILQRLQAFCPTGVVGDDGALLSLNPNHDLVVTSDTLVDGVHFSWGMANPEVWTTSPYDAGWRAAAANLSDLAAMGASPLGITVGLSVPGHLAVIELEAFYSGLRDCLTPFDTAIVGGDVCRSTVMVVGITAFGEVLPQQAIRRSVAHPGDAIIVTGYHGGSRGGLELLLHPQAPVCLEESDRQWLIQTHQRPQPRLDAINVLRQLASAWGQSPRVAGMDSSDGLADAVLQICRASQVGAILDRSAIPIHPALRRWRSPQEAMNWTLYGGEDFELVLCCEDAIAKTLVHHLGPPAAIIGCITANSSVIVRDFTQAWNDEILQLTHSFQHF